MVLACDVQMPKLSYAQIAQKNKESSADSASAAANERCMLEFEDIQQSVTSTPTVRDTSAQSSSGAGLEPRPQRGGSTSVNTTDPRPVHAHSHSHAARQQRGAGASAHVASSDDMRHRDYNGVASAAPRPLP